MAKVRPIEQVNTDVLYKRLEEAADCGDNETELRITLELEARQMDEHNPPAGFFDNPDMVDARRNDENLDLG